MSREEVEIVRASLEALDRGDTATALSFAHPDLLTIRLDPDRAMYHGEITRLDIYADRTEALDAVGFPE